VQVPFRQKIPPGSSEFDIGVPEEWMQDYEFYFSNIHLVPDYFSKLAASYKMDPDLELKLEHRFNLKVRVVYETAKSAATKEAAFTLSPNTTYSLRKVVAMFNQHFYANKLKGQRFAPVFLDWSTIATDNPNGMVEEDPEFHYPDEEFNADSHSDGLPDPEIRRKPWANKYRLPADARLDHYVLRLCVAPLTALHMSNLETLEKLGFRKSHLGTSVAHKQNRLRNDSEEWRIIEAHNSPDLMTFQLKHALKMTAQPCDPVAVLERDPVVLAIRDWDDTTQVCESVNRALRSVSDVLNLDIKLTFNLEEHKFHFTFPELFDVTLETDPELVLRLGYPAGNTMDRRQPVAERDSTIKVVDAQLLAQSLVMDTGNVNVYLTDAPSNTVKGDAGYLMADLYPDPQGLLKPASWSCPQAATQITSRVKTAERTVQLRFRLGRVYEFGKMDRFEWRTAAYVFGTLAGRPLATV